MPRLIIDDATRVDSRAKITTSKLSTISDITIPKTKYIEWVSGTTMKILAGLCISVGTTVFLFDSDTTINAVSVLDTGTLAYGKDYYIYLCDAGDNSSDAIIKVSLSSTFPLGYFSTNSRKIGGFHYGYYRPCTTNLTPLGIDSLEYGDSWPNNVFLGIVPRSIWTIYHRPKCNPEGMVCVNGNLWADIYEGSNDGAGGLLSLPNVLPITGTEGMTWFVANERAMVVDKRLPTYNEWCLLAYGSPVGSATVNTYGWTYVSNNYRTSTGTLPYATSSCGVRDAVGNVTEWTSSNMLYYSTYAPGWVNVFTSDYNTGFGQGYFCSGAGFCMLACGGYWSAGGNAGSRAYQADQQPWAHGVINGVRAVCDSI